MTRRLEIGSCEVSVEHLSPDSKPLLQLFCFPYAGGSADVYRGWQRCLPDQVDICLVHLPGRGDFIAEPSFTRLADLVDAVAGRLQEEVVAPYALYGHSMGALISFELSRELFRRHGTGPEHLFVSGCRAPQWPKSEPLIFNLPHDRFIAELERLNGTPREVLADPEFVELFINPLRADFELVETYDYHPAERLPCPITAYGALEDQDVPLESCRAWREQTSADYRMRILNGDHFFIRNPRSEFMTVFPNDIQSAIPSSRLQEI